MGIVSNDDVRNLIRELSTEVNKALIEFYTKLEARKLYLPPEVYDDARKLRDHLRNLANEYVITSEYPSPDP